MQASKQWLTGVMITSCLGLAAVGCSSTSSGKKEAMSRTGSGSMETQQGQVQVATRAKNATTEYTVKPPARPVTVATSSPSTQQAGLANRQRQQQQLERERLRQKYQREWEVRQQQEQKRAEYQRRWEQKQAEARRQQKVARQQPQAARVQQVPHWGHSPQSVQQQARQQQAHQQQQARQQQLVRQRQQQQAHQQQQARQQQLVRQRQQQQARQQQVAQTRAASVGRQPVQGYGGRGVGNYRASSLTGDFAGNKKLISFINNMSRKHGFDKSYLYGVFSKTRNRDVVARLWAGNDGGRSSGGRGWYNYRSKFVTPGNAQKGAQFWRKYQPQLIRASRKYGVDPEYIVGIIGVETRWGRILGKHRVIDALTTSAIVNKRRSRFFFDELENYLLMTRSERMDPLQPKGSYAGAMGYGQFMPSSFRAYAVDFNGDGIRDLWNPEDAIGSVANYFAEHGWKSGQEVAVPARVSNMQYASMPDGFRVKYSSARLAEKGIRPRSGRWSNTGRTHLLAFTTVPGGVKEPWIGYHNFYVITRYNRSNYYAMAVHQLAQEVKKRVGGQQYAVR